MSRKHAEAKLESGRLDNDDRMNRDSGKVSHAGRARRGPRDENGHWGRRNMFKMVVTTTLGPHFEDATQMESLKSVYAIGKILLYRGFLKTSTLYSFGNAVSEAKFLA